MKLTLLAKNGQRLFLAVAHSFVNWNHELVKWLVNREARLVYRFTSDLDNLGIGRDFMVNHYGFQFHTTELSVRNNSDGAYRFGTEFGDVVNPVNSASFSGHDSSYKRERLLFSHAAN